MAITFQGKYIIIRTLFYSIFKSVLVIILVSENSTIICILRLLILELNWRLNLELLSLILSSTFICVILTNRIVADWRSIIYLFSLSVEWMLIAFILVTLHIAILKFYISISAVTTTKQIALFLAIFLEYDLVSSTRPFDLTLIS